MGPAMYTFLFRVLISQSVREEKFETADRIGLKRSETWKQNILVSAETLEEAIVGCKKDVEDYIASRLKTIELYAEEANVASVSFNIESVEDLGSTPEKPIIIIKK